MIHVLLGDGVAGMSAAEVIRRERPDDRIVVVSDDPQPYYFRASLTNYLMGELAPEELWALPPNAWEQLRLERLFGRVTGLDPNAQLVKFADGDVLRYDRLLVGTGARARRLDTPEADPERGVRGADHRAVYALRTFADAQRLVEAATASRRAVVVGGGILGIELAQGLRERNLHVTLVHAKPWLLENLCDRKAAEIVALRMRRAGIDVRLSEGLAEIVPARGKDAGTRLRGVRLTGGDELDADFVALAIGIVPNTACLGGALPLTKRGHVRVDDRMRVVGVEGAWAAGDVAVVEGLSLPWTNPGGLWQPARKQGHVAGLAMSSDDPARSAPYRPGAIYGATRAFDLDLATLGDPVGDVDASRGERAIELTARVDGTPVYKRAKLRDGRVVGALLLGDRREGRALQRLMNLKGDAGDVSAIADRLFDAEFDLFAWVAAQERRAGPARHDAPPPIPRGALPPAVAASASAGREAPRGETGFTRLARAVPLVLTAAGVEREHRPDAGPVRIGGAADATVRVEDAFLGGEELVVSPEGALWIAVSSAGRSARALHNGRPLTAPAVLESGDALRLGRFQACVRLLGERPPAPPPPPALRARLVGTTTVEVSARVTTLGRGRDADVALADPEASVHHAQLLVAGDPPAHYLSDAGSTNGTFVNDAPVHTMRRLRDGDRIRIGRTVLRYEAAPDFRSGSDPDRNDFRSGSDPDRKDAPPDFRSGSDPDRKSEGWLVGVEGPNARRAIRLPLPAVVGRGVGVDVRLADGLLSRAHARFETGPDGPTVTDLGAANGVSLDGERLPAGVPRPLAELSRVRLGRSLYRFQTTLPEDRILTPEDTGHPHTGETGTIRILEGGPRIEVSGLGEPAVFPLVGARTRIGRDVRNDVLLGGDASKDHAELVAEDGAFALTDLGSTNGTRVDDRPLAPHTPTPLADGAVLRFGTVRAVFRAGDGRVGGAVPPRPSLRLEQGPSGATLAPIPLAGAGPWTIGRGDVAVRVPKAFEAVSRRHCEIRRSAGGFEVRDLGSTFGTAVNGRRVEAATWTPLVPGDVLRFDPERDDHAFRFDVEGLSGTGVPSPIPAVDGSILSAPSDEDLAVVVADELDACIGCHDCMRACPLPDAPIVGIGGLNAWAGGVGAPSEIVARFVADCTQCRACVPVCPVDIHRSRIVLWNKLKRVPSPSDRPSEDAGARRIDSERTYAAWIAHLGEHPLFAPLSRPERLALLGAARFRRLSRGEVLVAAGAYVDTVWIVTDGKLALDDDSGGAGTSELVRLGPGRTVGEVAVLSEEPAAYSARALVTTTVVGLPKYALVDLSKKSAPFHAALDRLHAERATESLLGALPGLSAASPAAVEALRGALVTRRFEAGATVLDRVDLSGDVHLLRRGFVSELRRTAGGREVIADYLRPGRTFGSTDSGRDGALVAFRASTRVEAAVLPASRIAALLTAAPELASVLARLRRARTDVASGGSASDLDDAVRAGLAQAHRPLVIDTRLCVDCDNCSDACARRHGISRLDRGSSGVQVGPFHVPQSCYHCADPVCLLCAVDGIVREPTGEIRIVADACIGCGACADRCPYDNIRIVERAPEPAPLWRRLLPESIWRRFGVLPDDDGAEASEQVAVKCDLCVGHDDGPACVRACPVGAAQRVDVFGALGLRAAPSKGGTT